MAKKSTVDKIDDQIKNLQDQIALLRNDKKAAKKRQYIRCGHCSKISTVASWIVLVDHYNVPPRGCTEGAYWTHSNNYHLICPKCDGLCRTYMLNQSYGPHYVPNKHLYELASETSLFAECFDMFKSSYTRSEVDLPKLRREKKEKENRI